MSASQTRVSRLRWRGTVAQRDEARSLVAEAGDVALVERGCPRFLVIKCPCGCGEELVINLDQRIGSAWRFYRRRGGLTVYPSVWRESGCGSHFIIWDDRILWCNEESLWSGTLDTAMASRVLPEFPKVGRRFYAEIADVLDEPPWAVLMCCRDLVKRALLREGIGDLRGWFERG